MDFPFRRFDSAMLGWTLTLLEERNLFGDITDQSCAMKSRVLQSEALLDVMFFLVVPLLDNYNLMRGGSSDEFCRCQACLGKYTLLGDEENPRLAMFERKLPFFGCGIGWCCVLLGFLCPLVWYIAALLYCCKYYNRDPRERPGLAASALLAIMFTAATIVTLSILLILCAHKRFLSSCCG